MTQIITQSSEQINIVYISASECRLVCNRGIISEVVNHFQFYVKGYKHMALFKSGRWDGRIKLINSLGIFQLGYIRQVVSFLSGRGYRNISLIDFPPIFKQSFNTSIDHLPLPFEPHDFQGLSVELFDKHKRVVFISPTASGKSLIVYLLLRYLIDNNIDGKYLIIVPTIALSLQLRSDLAEYSVEDDNFSVDELVHVISDGAEKHNRAKVTISTWQSLQEIKDDNFFKVFTCVGCDEAHQAGGKTISAILNKCTSANYRFGLTGTIDNKDEAVTATVESNIGRYMRLTTTAELMERGIVSKISIKGLIFKHKVVKGSKSPKYADEIKYLINHDTRNETICKMASKLKGNTLILFNNHEHGDSLFAKMAKYTDKEAILIDGRKKATKREADRHYAEQKDNLVLIASYGTFSTGINIKNIHNIILAHPTRSMYRVLQSIGRGLRLHKDKMFLSLYDIGDDLRVSGKSQQNHTLRHFFSRLEIYTRESFEYTMHEKELPS